MIKNVYFQFLVFLAASFLAVALDRFFVDSSVVLKILAILVLALLILVRWTNLKSDLFLKNIFWQILIFFLVPLLVILLIISTGGFFSPFFVVIHIATLALAFLISFQSAVAFLSAVLLTAVFHLYLSFKLEFLSVDVPLLLVYLGSLGAIVPLAAVVASRYRLKSQIADYFFKQLFISKSEEFLIMGNIDEGVITLDQNLKIVHVNNIAQKLTSFGENELTGKPFFNIFKLKDSKGVEIGLENLPVKSLLANRASFAETTLAMRKADGSFFNVEFKFSSIIGVNGQVEGILFIFNDLTRQVTSARLHSILENGFLRLMDLFDLIDKQSAKLKDWQKLGTEIEQISTSIGQDINKSSWLARNLLTLHRAETGELSALVTIVDIREIVRKACEKMLSSGQHGEVKIVFLPDEKKDEIIQPASEKNLHKEAYHKPLSTVTNLGLLTEAIEELMELGIIIASGQQAARLEMDVAASDGGILILERVFCKQFPWEKASELFAPFFGKLAENNLLAEASGLEGYLVWLLVTKIGGSLSVEKVASRISGDQLVFKVLLTNTNS